MEVKIRESTSSDLEEIANLFNLYRMFYKQESDLDGARSYIAARLRLGDSVIFIASNTKNVAVGFTQLYPTFSSQSMQRMWILNDLYVEEGSRKGGVASALLNKAKEFSLAECAKGLMLCTQRTNTSAQALYKKHGYTPVSEFQWYFLKT